MAELGLGAALEQRLAAGPAELITMISRRVYPNYAPAEAELPHVIYHVNSSARGRVSGNLVEKRLTVQVTATTYASASAIEDLIRKHLDGWRGWSAGLNIRGVFLDSSEDAVAEDVDGSERKDDAKLMEFRIYYKESTPAAEQAAAE